MSKILRRHRFGSTTHEGWKHTKQITKDELKEMPDPDGGRAAQMAVAIPSPFARMHLVETALEYVKLHPAETASIHHRLLGQLWDAWEIIFNYHQLERAGQKLLIRTWQRQAEMAALEANPATRALGQVLKLYLEQSDPRFSTLTDLHLFYWTKPDGTPHLLAGTSPLTVLFPAPDLVEPLMQRTAGGGHYFDGTYFSLFRIYGSADGKPAAYSPSNVPLKPRHFLPISLAPVKEGDFTLVFGFPGRTTEYLTSWGVRELQEISDPARVALRDLSVSQSSPLLRFRHWDSGGYQHVLGR